MRWPPRQSCHPHDGPRSTTKTWRRIDSKLIWAERNATEQSKFGKRPSPALVCSYRVRDVRDWIVVRCETHRDSKASIVKYPSDGFDGCQRPDVGIARAFARSRCVYTNEPSKNYTGDSLLQCACNLDYSMARPRQLIADAATALLHHVRRRPRFRRVAMLTGGTIVMVFFSILSAVSRSDRRTRL